MSKMKRLECPLCSLTVLSKDSYFLQLHFEQAHSPGSPFAIKDDPEPLPPSLQPKPAPTRTQDEDSPSSSDSDDSDDSEESGDTETDDSDEPADSSQEERTIKSPVSNRREFIPPSPTKDRINYHSTETSSPHRSTGKYHSRHRSATMHNPPSTSRSHRRHAKSTSVEHYVSMDVPDSPRRTDGHSRKPRKHGHRRRRNSNDSDKTTISRSILGFNPFAKSDKDIKPPIKSARLGKSELGPYAWEERMPKWLHKQLSAGPEITIVNRIGRDGRLIKQEQVQNETAGIIPILAQLSALDRTVKRAYYCHPSTLHVGKTPHEGGFCGYRNIHMLLSYIQGAKAQGHEEFPGRLPTILKIQDLIEDAWDNGINEIGRVQTGGIRDTRKYIGTPEAQAFFLNAEINCAVEQFSDNKDRGTSAHETLLAAIERYFARVAASDGSTVCKTLLPPIYLQQPGHSLSIVGFERHYDGSCNLVVFDPMYSTSPPMHKLLGRKNIRTPRPEVMHIYRRGYRKLKKYAAYEILMLTATPPLFPAWDVLRQFPDCRFVYVFFRARSLGYDVYPEDYFLPSFPWQQYGGLWSCDDARFARGEPMKALMAQALQRITSEGTSAGPRICNIPPSPTNFFANSPFQHVPAFEPDSLPSWANESNNTTSGFARQSPPTSSNTVSQGVSLSTVFPQPKAIKPQLSLLTDVGRRYPGFPTPLSPTSKARELFPSPISDASDIAPTPGTQSPTVRSLSPMSFDESELYDPSRRCEYHGLEKHRPGIRLIDEILAGPQTRGGSRTPLTSPRSISGVTTPPASPSRCVSPRIAMLKKLTGKQDIQGPPPSPNPAVDPGPRLEFHPSTRNLNVYPASPPPTPTESCSVPHSPLSPPTSIPIANGIEFETVSPIDPSGTMLLYTSNRSVDSGLLGVHPLSEEQVAEYRFWRPCGRRNCGFGCGGANVGEAAAAKRLFREAEDVSVEHDDKKCDGKDHSWAKKQGRYDHGLDGQNEDSTSGESCGCGRERSKASVWAGRRLVTDWGSFLQGCEREGVAAV